MSRQPIGEIRATLLALSDEAMGKLLLRQMDETTPAALGRYLRSQLESLSDDELFRAGEAWERMKSASVADHEQPAPSLMKHRRTSKELLRHKRIT